MGRLPSVTELEPYGTASTRRYIYSLEFYRRWPKMEASIKQFEEDIKNGIPRPSDNEWLEEMRFTTAVQLMAEGKPLQHRGFYRGEFPYTVFEDFMEALPYREVNPFQGKRY